MREENLNAVHMSLYLCRMNNRDETVVFGVMIHRNRYHGWLSKSRRTICR